jgi:hypothetical protein
MKTKNTYTMGMTLAVLFMLAACNALTGPEVRTGSGEPIPQGMGLAHIRLGGAKARTAVPNIGDYYYTLDFTAPGKPEKNEVLNGGTNLTVALEPAVWTLDVKGYADSTKTAIKARGSASISITAGTTASFEVYLTPDFNFAGEGSLFYSIVFPATVSRAFLSLDPLDAPGTSDVPATSREIDISGSAEGSASGTLVDLPEGVYLAAIDLYNGDSNSVAVWAGAVHIGSSITTLARSFTAGDFSDCPPVIGGSTLAAKLDAALSSPSGSYTIVLDSMETDLASFMPKTLTVTGNKDITITIRGNGKTVQLGGAGILLTLGADSGSSLKLIFQDLTLRGVSNNNAPLVQVGERGTLDLRTGSLITGNTAAVSSSDSGTGGVYVSYGAFTMNGGTVSGNATTTTTTSSYSGGGVYVANGTFTMNGGTVSGNTTTIYTPYRRSAGGVYVYNDGIFTINSGTVSGNTSYNGGGVYIAGSGIFTINGGAVSGNTAALGGSGGGVYVDGSGTFIINDGAVSGNTAVSGGGGVYIDSSRTFTINGGTVSGNTSFYSGGGVYVANGTFTMNDGAVSGKTITSSSSASGGGVYVIGGGTFIMNDGAVSGNIVTTTSSSSGGSGGGVHVLAYGTFTMNGGAVSGNTSPFIGGGVYVSGAGTFTMNNGMVSDNTSSSRGGGVSVGGHGSHENEEATFTINGGTVSGNTSSSRGGGVYVFNDGTFTMSGGTVSGNTSSFGDEVYVGKGIFTISGPARPERVFLNDNTQFIAIGGSLSSGTVPIDLGITGSAPLSGYVNKQILRLDNSYNLGDLASLKEHFTLGNAMLTESPYTETPITGYKIDDDGLFAAE